MLLLVFYLSKQTYFIFLPRHQGCSFMSLDVTKSHNSLSSAVKRKKKKKLLVPGRRIRPEKTFTHATHKDILGVYLTSEQCQNNKRCRAPQNPPLAKVNGAMIKWRVFDLEGK